MWRFDPEGMFGIFAGIVLGLGFFALIAYLVYLFVYKRIQMNHEMRLEMVKQGIAPPLERESYGSLKSGIVLTAVGIAFFLALLLDKFSDGDRIGAEMVIPFVPLFVGVGLILFHRIARKNGKTTTNVAGHLSEVSES